MRNNNKAVSFDGQDFHIGVDVHHSNWKVTIRTMGVELKTMVMPPDAEKLYSYMNRNYPNGVYHSAYEAGFSGFWTHRDLERLGINNRVVHAADIPTTDKERRQKEDKRDSRKIARSLENGELKALNVPSPEIEALRSLCRLRERSMSHRTRLKNRIKSFLKYYGVHMKEDSTYRCWSGAFIKRLEKLCCEAGPWSDCLKLQIDALNEESTRLASVMQKLRLHCKDGEAGRIISLMRTVPGIGPTTALTFYTEIQDIRRFPNLNKLNSYIGLIPSTDSSNDDGKTTGITPRSSRRLRKLLVEASWRAVSCDPGLLSDFSKLSCRMKKQAAIIRIARKLAARVAYVWREGEPYQPVVPLS